MDDLLLRRMISSVMALIFVGLCCVPTVYGQESQKAEAVISQAGDWKLTFADLERIVSYYPEEQRALILQDPKKLMTLARSLTQAKVLSDKAYADGLNDRPDIREQLKINEQHKLSLAYVQEKTLKGLNVSEEDVRLYYQGHKDDYKVPAQVKVRHILLRLRKNADKEVVQQTRQRAEDILKKVKAGEDFAVSAAAFSEDPGSRDRGGDLGWVVRSKLDPAFAKAAFAAKKGQVVGPVRSAYGFHLLKVEDRRPARQMPCEAVAERIRKELMSQLKKSKVHEFIEAAMKEAGATINNERILDLAVK
ncbi:MAG: peptidylprolyl isomerase [Deltaproteobacteria bacterium]|nr:peptidylprolyl isomerase [Deltaproteobacteria bacterium]